MEQLGQARQVKIQKENTIIVDGAGVTGVHDLIHNNAALNAGVSGNLADGLLQGAEHNGMIY